MEAHAAIRHKLDLALHLVNAVTGRGIEEYNTRFITKNDDFILQIRNKNV